MIVAVEEETVVRRLLIEEIVEEVVEDEYETIELNRIYTLAESKGELKSLGSL
jgi:hypothetical protein